MGFSKFEFRPIGSFRYIEGYLVWRVQKKQVRNTLFWTNGVTTSKFECAVKTYKVSATINCKAYYKNRLL